MKQNRSLRILVTGGTGFLGRSVVPRLRKNGHTIVALSREASCPGAPSAAKKKDLEYFQIKGDLTLWDGGWDLAADSRLADLGPFDLVLHMAALYDLNAKETQLMKHNVLGTQVALTLAQKLGIETFVNISSVAVAVNARSRRVDPTELHFENPFPDAYALSKAIAEKMVAEWPNPLRRLNLRLGVLVGDTVTGRIERIDGPYHCPEALRKFLDWLKQIPGPLPLPGKSDRRLPLVPIDQAANGVVRALEIFVCEKTEGHKALHLIPKFGLSVQELYASSLRHFGINKRVILLENIPDELSREFANRVGNLPKKELNYILRLPRLDETETREWLGETWCSEFFEYEKQFWSGYEQFVSHR